MNVKTLCLGVLTKQNATGYEIKKSIEEGEFNHFVDASFGSIYPALNQLASDGLVTVEELEQARRPDKKIYAITEKGREAFVRAIAQPAGKDKYRSDFLFKMLFQPLLTNEQLVAAIDKQIADLQEDLACIEECTLKGEPTPCGEFVAGYGRVVLTAAVTYLEQKRLGLLKPVAAVAAE